MSSQHVKETEQTGPEWEDEAAPAMEVPLGIVLARILIVTAMSFSAAVAIFCAVGAIWALAGVAVVSTIFFLLLMFAVERLAER
jgi:hypothetical protein